jgi:hypothetical protein
MAATQVRAFSPFVGRPYGSFSRGAAGTITSQALKRNNGTVAASSALTWVGVRDAATGANVLVKTGVSTDGSGVFAFSDPALSIGASYAVQWLEASGQRGQATATAT